MKYTLPFLWVCVCTLFLLISCQMQSSNMRELSSTSEKQVLRVNLQTDPISLDPRKGGDRRSQIIVRGLFEGLMRMDTTGKPVPAMAENVAISDDRMTYTFVLRNAKWSNGLPVTAYDFEYAWKHSLAPDFDSSYAFAFFILKNAKAAKQNLASIDDIGVKALDDHTLVVQLEHPAPYFLELTANPVYSPICKEVDLKNPKWGQQNGKDFVCNGPFVLDKWTRNSSVKISKNLSYWDVNHVSLDEILVSIVEDSYTTLLMFERNELDWAGEPFSELSLAAASALKAEGKLQIHPIGAIYWFEFNTAKAPFHSMKIRQAFAQAIDRKAIVEHVLQGGEQPALSILPKNLAVSSQAPFRDGDIQNARKLFEEGLEELGISREEFPKVVLSYSFIPGQKTLAEVIQQQWNEAFDLAVELEGFEWNVYLEKTTNGDFQVGGVTWHSWFNDPIYNLEYLKYRHNGINPTSWEHPQYIALLDASDREIDVEIRKQQLQDAEWLLLTEMPIAPVYYYTNRYLKKPYVKGVYLSDLGQVDLKWAKIER